MQCNYKGSGPKNIGPLTERCRRLRHLHILGVVITSKGWAGERAPCNGSFYHARPRSHAPREALLHLAAQRGGRHSAMT